MKKGIKMGGSILLGGVILLLLIMLASFGYHRFQLSQEEEHFVPLGDVVEVDGHNMHVYTEGEGDVSFVFMSGGGTSSPVLDFKSLFSLLSDQHKIVVVEKFGYGFSEVVDTPRDIESILSDTRQALKLAGHQPPYILVPHSMSGLEALYWAQKYPNEVSAIIGLDMAVPEAYKNYPINLPLIRLSKYSADLGIIRFIPGVSESDAMKYGTLAEEEKELYRAIFYRRTATRTMLNEIERVKENADVVRVNGLPDIPILLFSSNGAGTGFDADHWKEVHSEFIDQVADGKMIHVDAPHYLHNYEYEHIASEIDQFLENE